MDAGDEDRDEGDDSKNGYKILLAWLSVEFVFICLSCCWFVMRPSSKIANMLRQYILSLISFASISLSSLRIVIVTLGPVLAGAAEPPRFGPC